MDGDARAGCGGETIILVTGQWKVGLSVFLLIFGGHAPHAGSTLASSMQVRYYSCKIAGHIVQPSRVAGAPSSTIWLLGTLHENFILYVPPRR